MKKENFDKKAVEEKIIINRAQIEHRATWMALIYQEVEKAGLNPEEIFRTAIRNCGKIHGRKLLDSGVNLHDVNSFSNLFFNETGVKTFDMDNITSTNDEAFVQFHYCALVEAWKKLGLSDELISKLCDIAMEGDRGIADVMGLNLVIDGTIAEKCPACKLHFAKKNLP